MRTKFKLFLLCLISQMYSFSSYADVWSPRETNFHCKNYDKWHQEYIHHTFVCDLDNDCLNGDDENIGCGNEENTCGEGKFACDNGQCKYATSRCNTIQDCQDGTDELNCGDEVNVKNCTGDDKFLCKDGLRCLGIEHTCDQKCQCFDCSDENENCTILDNELMEKCPRGYFVFGNGPKCFCDVSNYSGMLCDKVEDCTSTLHCSQSCAKYKHTMQCSCYKGFFYNKNMDGDVVCKARKDLETILLYSNQHEIILLNYTSRKSERIISEVVNCTLLTAANDLIYFTTSSSYNLGGIFKMPLKSGKPKKTIQTDLAITSIAIDYITNNIYFTSNGSLSVCTTNGEICTQLKCCDVQYVAVAPKFGWMFYVRTQAEHCLNGSLIMKSNMDGSNEMIFSKDLYDGDISLMIDESEKTVHLLENNMENGDHKAIFNQISFDSVFRKALTSNNNIQTFGIYDEKIFFKAKQDYTKGISEISINYDDLLLLASLRKSKYGIRFLHSDVEDISKKYLEDNTTSTLTSLYLYNSAMKSDSENPCEKSLCSGICLVTSSTLLSSNFSLNHTCVCDGFTPDDSNRWCTSDSAKSGNHGVVWIVVSILVLIVLSVTGYYVFKKPNLHWCYLEFRHWVQRKSDGRILDVQN